MKTWRRTLRDAAIAGTIAGLASTAALVLCGRRDTGYPTAAVNAPSQWVFGEKALDENHGSLRFTATGLAIHQASAVFWALVHEIAAYRVPCPSPRRAVCASAVTTMLAALVDLRVVPDRLTPGFQRRLCAASLIGVYALFGLGLAAGSLLINKAGGAPRSAAPVTPAMGKSYKPER